MDSQTYILSKVVEKFCKDFLKEIEDLSNTLSKLGINNIKSSLPSPFRGEAKTKIVANYSFDKKQLFLMFNKSENDSFSFLPVRGNPIPFDIFIFEGTGVGSSSFQDITLGDGIGAINIEFAFILSHAGFIYRLNNVREFTINFINAHSDHYIYNKQHTNESYSSYLEHLKLQLSELFFDEKVPELAIDKFLENNPIVLKRGLQLENLNHQVVLKNLLNKYEHDLKPDLIAFNTLNKCWVIVDYKRAKRSIIKNLGKVRMGFTSDVNNLENQLLDYKEYFEEKEHREYVVKNYKLDIQLPSAIGIIGNVSIEEQIAFTRLMRNKPQWFSVIPYNYLYDNFCRYVEEVKELTRR